jgi:hypothetical protein
MLNENGYLAVFSKLLNERLSFLKQGAKSLILMAKFQNN